MLTFPIYVSFLLISNIYVVISNIPQCLCLKWRKCWKQLTRKNGIMSKKNRRFLKKSTFVNYCKPKIWEKLSHVYGASTGPMHQLGPLKRHFKGLDGIYAVHKLSVCMWISSSILTPVKIAEIWTLRRLLANQNLNSQTLSPLFYLSFSLSYSKTKCL